MDDIILENDNNVIVVSFSLKKDTLQNLDLMAKEAKRSRSQFVDLLINKEYSLNCISIIESN